MIRREREGRKRRVGGVTEKMALVDCVCVWENKTKAAYILYYKKKKGGFRAGC